MNLSLHSYLQSTPKGLLQGITHKRNAPLPLRQNTIHSQERMWHPLHNLEVDLDTSLLKFLGILLTLRPQHVQLANHDQRRGSLAQSPV